MEKNPSIELQKLLAEITLSMRKGEGEKIAPIGYIEAAQKLGCKLATGATFTKLIATIEAEIAAQLSKG
jgi:hypothetical protein